MRHHWEIFDVQTSIYHSGSGGGTAGQVGYPEYLEDAHEALIGTEEADTTLMTIINDQIEGNPFLGNLISDPDMILLDSAASIRDRYVESTSIAASIYPQSNWGAFVDIVREKLTEEGVLDVVDIEEIFHDARESTSLSVQEAVAAALTAIEDVVVRHTVRQFERRADTARRTAINRFAGNMSDINAVQSSAFILGMASIEAQHMQSVDEFDANLSMQIYQGAFTSAMESFRQDVGVRLSNRLQQKVIHDQMLDKHTVLMLESVFAKAELENSVTALAYELGRIRLVGQKEYEGMTIDLSEKAVTWNMHTFMGAGQFMGALGGGTYLPEKPSSISSALGGFLGGSGVGAMTGAKIGAAGGPIGATGGAVIGGLLGLGAGLL